MAPKRKKGAAEQKQGGRWPEEVKTAALTALLTSNNLSAVARRYGVPEATLRLWKAHAQRGEDEFSRLRAEATRKLVQDATAGAAASIALIVQRLEQDAYDQAIRAAVTRRLDDGHGLPYIINGEPVPGAKGISPVEAEQLKALMLNHAGLDDDTLNRYALTLAKVVESSRQLLGEDEAEKTTTINVSFGGEFGGKKDAESGDD